MPEPIAPIPELLKQIKSDSSSILRDGHKEVFIARAPGRLDVMGGMTAYSGGMSCQYPLAASTAVALQRRDDRKLVIKTYAAEEAEGPAAPMVLSLDDFYGTASLLSQDAMQHLFAGGNEWAACVAGAFPTLARHKKLTRSSHGANIAFLSTLPARAGVGAEAALACATLWAMTAAYHLILDPMEIAILAQRIESQVAGVQGHVSDAATSVLGRKDQLLLLECQPHELKGFVSIPGGLAIVGIDTGVPQALGEAYHTARATMAMAQAIVGRFYVDTGIKKDPTKGYLANVSAGNYRKYFRPLMPEGISGKEFLAEYGPIGDRGTHVEPAAMYEVRGAADHHVQEVDRTRQLVDELRAMNNQHQPKADGPRAEAAGRLLTESHASARQVGLVSKEADRLVALLGEEGADHGFYGARLSGAGTAATVVLLAEDSAKARTALDAVLQRYEAATHVKAAILSGSSPGAGEAAPLRVPAKEVA